MSGCRGVGGVGGQAGNESGRLRTVCRHPPALEDGEGTPHLVGTEGREGGGIAWS